MIPMIHGSKKLNALAELDPDRWHSVVKGALVSSQGNVREAAVILHVGVSTLWRWIAKNPSLIKDVGHVGNPAQEKRRLSLDTSLK